MKKVLSIFLSVTLILGLVISTPSQVKAATINAEYLEHGDGIIYPTGGTIEQCTAIPDDGKFVQMGPNSWITLRFPGNYAAVPDGTSAADLRIDTYDVPYRADAEILVSLNGTNWISVGLWPDTANIDLDLAGVDGPVKYVKIDQGSNYIDP
ncbi:MAG: hypothetical protein JXB33_09070, partial [Clostridia bacterium]|nr:hypothetical protein [Clostridia bacterium]